MPAVTIDIILGIVTKLMGLLDTSPFFQPSNGYFTVVIYSFLFF